MRRMTWTAAIVLSIVLLLAACGKKDAESVVKDLDKLMNTMESYQGSGTMTLHSGEQPQTYDVEVTYQQPHNYRIKLTNEQKNVTQIILKNDDGVFVLTPKLNKVFRFQSDWPQNQGQVYLYQTLLQSIVVDGSRQFETSDKEYVFDVMANYNNGTFSRQKIWLNKDDYRPLQVEVSDTNAKVMVDVKFTAFEFDAKLDPAMFDTDANMKEGPVTGSADPTTATPEMTDQQAEEANNQATESAAEQTEEQQTEQTKEEATEETTEQVKEEEAEQSDDKSRDAEQSSEEPSAMETPEQSDDQIVAGQFVAMGPSYMPGDVVMGETVDIVFGGNPGMMTRYEGSYNYTLIQTQPKDVAASLVPGIIHDLGFTIAEMTVGEDSLKTLTWTYEGQQFRLTSADLPDTEMTKIAQSVQGKMEK
ncbi:outer membrane lipoprotein carrier protein LolA [Paenibacillus yanchengensis]|uniref:Outer membrane lipoprotein carrier protein LolA n=1 Tax=Paenibacillus yanchengensis TaxID=2035833 RepID=A0ABW4YJC6_9BACL